MGCFGYLKLTWAQGWNGWVHRSSIHGKLLRRKTAPIFQEVFRLWILGGWENIWRIITTCFVYPSTLSEAPAFGNDIGHFWKQDTGLDGSVVWTHTAVLTPLATSSRWAYRKEGQAAVLINKFLINSEPMKGVSLTLSKFKRTEVTTRWNC